MKVKFVHNPYMDQYHGRVSFTKVGEVQEVSQEVGEYLLSVHPDKFVLVEDTPPPIIPEPIATPHAVIIEDDLQAEVIRYVTANQPIGIMDIVRAMDSTYNKIKSIVDTLMAENVLGRDPDKKYFVNRR